MTHFFNSFLRRVSFTYSTNSSHFPSCSSYIVQFHSRYICIMAFKLVQNEDTNESLISFNRQRIPPNTRKEAQIALSDYLHFTRNLPFSDAEHMSINSPQFLRKLIANASFDRDFRPSFARYLRYHPINEFEPFFESIGLDPCEFLPLLPRDLMFLSDETRLLDNYFILCQYGVARCSIGKIYRRARELFHNRNGDLKSKLRDFEEVGVSKPVIAKAVCFNPCLLIDDMGVEFFKLVARLQCLACEYDWVEQNLLENVRYNWRQVSELLNIISDLVCGNHELRNLVRQHPELLFDHSGRRTFALIGFLVKVGSSKTEIHSLLLQFPQVEVGKFVRNLGRAFELLSEIELDNASTGIIIRTHLIMLGSCSLKKASCVLHYLNRPKRYVCELIRENPLVLKNWVLGAKIEKLPSSRLHSHKCKIAFLSRIGFSENSKLMERGLKIQGRGEVLQERYECLVKAGLSEDDVVHMIKQAPRILNISREVIEAKIRYLVCDLGYPVSSLTLFPRYLEFTTERVKLRCSMYRWLVNQNAIRPSLALRSIIACTDSHFVKKYVNIHPEGLAVWQELKKTFSV